VGTPYPYTGLDDKTFSKTLAEFVKQAQKQEEELDSTVYYKILPGLDDAKRRFAEHKGDPRYRLNGCAGIEAYIRELGLKPATVRNVWSAARLQAKSLGGWDWSARMYPACFWSNAPGHNGVRTPLV
jgi:hypothetical protein